MKCFHHFDDGDVRTVVDELMIGFGGVGPAPCVGESVELRLACFPLGLAKEDVVIGVRVKWRIEIDKIDTRVGKFFRVPTASSRLSPKYNRFIQISSERFSTSLGIARLVAQI